MPSTTALPSTPSPSFSAIPTTTPPTYTIATATIISILLIFLLIGSWIFFSTTSKDIAPSPPSNSRYTTHPTSTNTLPNWFRAIAHNSPTLPLFKQSDTDLALLREVLWSHPEDDYKPAKRRAAPKQQPLPSHPAKTTTKPSPSPTAPITAHIPPRSTLPSLLARRHIPASNHPLALALPVIADKRQAVGPKKGKNKGRNPIKPPPAMLRTAHLKISAPKLPKSVAERLALRYQLISPLRPQSAVSSSVSSISAVAIISSVAAPTKVGNLTSSLSTSAAASKAPSAAAAGSATAIVLSPTIAHRRILTSGPTEGDVIADLKSPYIYTPDCVCSPVYAPSASASGSATGKGYTPYRAGFVGESEGVGVGGIDGVVLRGAGIVEVVRGGGMGGGVGGGVGVLSPKLPHPGNRWVGSL